MGKHKYSYARDRSRNKVTRHTSKKYKSKLDRSSTSHHRKNHRRYK